MWLGLGLGQSHIPANRRRRRKVKSQIWDSKIWRRVPRDSDPRKTALARTSSIYKRETRPLVREGATQNQDRKCQTLLNIWSSDRARNQDLLTDWLTGCQLQCGFDFERTRQFRSVEEMREDQDAEQSSEKNLEKRRFTEIAVQGHNRWRRNVRNDDWSGRIVWKALLESDRNQNCKGAVVQYPSSCNPELTISCRVTRQYYYKET
jgi:hypothetical protein